MNGDLCKGFKNLLQYLVCITIVIINCLFLQSITNASEKYQQIASENLKEDKEKAGTSSGQENSQKYYNINRLQYRVPIGNGEGALMQSSFILFPNKLFFVETLEFLNPVGVGTDFKYRNLNFEMNIGRPFNPASKIGKTLGWVARVQAGSNFKPNYSLGLHWDISSLGGIEKFARQYKIESFLQSFFLKKERTEYGDFDFFLWLQLKGLSEKFYVRGAITYQYIADNRDSIYTMCDIIFPIHKNFDLYTRYAYQNKENFDRSKGSQMSLGVRFNFKL